MNYLNQNKTPTLWEAAPRPAYLFEEHFSSRTTWYYNIYQYHVHVIQNKKSKIKEGGRGGGVTEMHAVLSSNEKTYIPIPAIRSNKYSYPLW